MKKEDGKTDLYELYLRGWQVRCSCRVTTPIQPLPAVLVWVSEHLQTHAYHWIRIYPVVSDEGPPGSTPLR